MEQGEVKKETVKMETDRDAADEGDAERDARWKKVKEGRVDVNRLQRLARQGESSDEEDEGRGFRNL